MSRRAKEGQGFGRGNVIGWKNQLAEEPVERIQFTRLADEHKANMNSVRKTVHEFVLVSQYLLDLPEATILW